MWSSERYMLKEEAIQHGSNESSAVWRKEKT
jgi:hypothetical protein